MKTKLILLFVFFTQIFIAQTSTITVFSQEGERFYVIVNGARQNDAPSTNVKVTDLDKPNYLVKIIFEDQNTASLNQNVYLLDYDEKRTNVTYNLKRDRKKVMKMSLNSFDYDLNQSKTAEVVKYHEIENPITKPTTIVKNTEINAVDVNMMGIGINTNIQNSEDSMNVNINIGGLNTSVQTTAVTTTTSTNTSNAVKTKPNQDIKIVQPNTVQPILAQDDFDVVKTTSDCKKVMPNADFQRAKASIAKQSFADSKMKAAKQITTINCLSTAQIIDVVSLFSFEGDKLDYAKLAYTRCIDKDNYYQVNDVFSFSATSDELIEYIDKLTK